MLDTIQSYMCVLYMYAILENINYTCMCYYTYTRTYTIIVILYRDPSIVNEIAPWAQKRLDSYAGLIESRLASMTTATTEEEERML